MSLAILRRAGGFTLAGALLMAAAPARAQTAAGSAQAPAAAAATPALSKAQIEALARVQVAIGAAHDSIDAELAQSRNKTENAQKTLRERLHDQVEDILRSGGLTDSQYRHATFLISTDSAARRVFDGVVAELTGVPTPGKLAPSSAKTVPVPPGAVGMHIGHVINGFSDTPGGQSLLAVALAEAQTAAQHAALAARDPSNLNAMKTHAGHVIHALDPTVVASGPGLGYGARKAAAGVATHIDLAAKAQGASPNVVTHAHHVATAALNTVSRADQLLALAKQVQAATDASVAAALVSQMVSLSEQLTAGVDRDGDGQITWEEGGLQQAQDHVTIMLMGEHLPPRD